jgi:hypothetical protein
VWQCKVGSASALQFGPSHFSRYDDMGLDVTHCSKRSAWARRHPCLFETNCIRYFPAQMEAFAHTHTQHTLHAYTILHLHLHSDLRLRLHTHNNSGRVISLPVTQGRKLAGREAEVVKVQANRSTNRTCRSQRLNERGIFIPCHFIVPSGCSCACVCVRSCGAPISRLAAE